MLFRFRSRTGAGALGLVVLSFLYLPLDAWPASDEKPDAASPEAQNVRASENVTTSLTIHAPSVAVRSNPAGKSASPQSTQSAPGQWVFVDQNGRRLESPPAGVTLPEVLPRSQGEPISCPSPSDPNATVIYARHIHAVTSVRITEDGKIEQTCTQHHDSPDHACEVHAATDVIRRSKDSSGASSKEDRE